ncbi:MAG TPA: rhodanese-like domain-containing protein [Deltaproteobacteria bacterium]|nr:rhodanese-like domain-containing protein [Deltaproteobacteria bacterium]
MKRGFKALSSVIAAVALAAGAVFAAGYESISGAQLEAMMKDGEKLVIIDVREPELYAQGHIPGAVNIPYETARKRILKELDRDERNVFVCHGGPMGDELAGILVENGFRHVYNLRGGMRWWRGPVTK